MQRRWGRGHREGQRGGRGGRGRGCRSGRSQNELNLGSGLLLFEGRAQQDMLPPEREEELKVSFVYEAGRFGVGVGSRGQREGGGDGGAVGLETVGLGAAGRRDLGDVPRGGASGADAHNKSHAVPEAADDGAAELLVLCEGGEHLLPLGPEEASVVVAVDLVRDVGEGGGGRGGAAGGGEGEPALEGVEAGALRKAQSELVAEGGGDGIIKERARNILLAGLVKLGALARLEAGRGVERVVDRVIEEGAKVVMHHPAALARGSEWKLRLGRRRRDAGLRRRGWWFSGAVRARSIDDGDIAGGRVGVGHAGREVHGDDACEANKLRLWRAARGSRRW